MIREHPFEISHYIIESWEEGMRTGNQEYLEEKVELCTYQRRSWMASARSTKAVGARPWVEVNMAWKYHRHLMMLLRAVQTTPEPVQASLF